MLFLILKGFPNGRARAHSPQVRSACVSSAQLLVKLWAILVVTFVAVASARAAEPRIPASDAQPGLHRVGLATPARPALAATLGYGYTEKQDDHDGAHHRLSLRAAAALPVTTWLSVGPVLDGRYDLHRHDSGTVLDAALLARATVSPGAWRLGAELRGWVPGAENAGTMARAASLDARALVGAELGVVRLASAVGFRLDRSSAAGKDAARLGPGDRLALGLSDYDAVLLGLGTAIPLGKNELIAEASGDVLVGRGAPGLSQSPLRLAAGVRRELSPALGVELLAVGSLSGKPDLTATGPLVPNEPRVSLLAGVRYSFLPAPNANATEPVAPAPSAKPAPPPEPSPARPSDALVEITLRDEQNAPVSDASVVLTRGAERSELAQDGPGRYRREHVAAGAAVVGVEAKGFQALERGVTIEPGVPLRLDLVLSAVAPPSQVRGLIRSLAGKGLSAKIRVEPAGLEATTDADGAFRIDLPPGSYDVVIESPGYAPQRRHVAVDPEGVVILNAELVKKR
jgi:hypothetical protein